MQFVPMRLPRHAGMWPRKLLSNVNNSELTYHRQKRSVNFKWGTDKIRGVNIGGWLVLEPYVLLSSDAFSLKT